MPRGSLVGVQKVYPYVATHGRCLRVFSRQLLKDLRCKPSWVAGIQRCLTNIAKATEKHHHPLQANTETTVWRSSKPVKIFISRNDRQIKSVYFENLNKRNGHGNYSIPKINNYLNESIYVDIVSTLMPHFLAWVARNSGT